MAVGTYPQESGWTTINSDNDLKILLPQFERLGFKVKTLVNEEATKKHIQQALNHLTKQIQLNDEVCLHFSCHGQQMEDTNGDEPDGLDEALIPYDARLTYRKGVYEGENHLRDDELETYLNAIRRKIGENGSLTVTLDACHSGTATREEEYVEDDDAPVRGSTHIFSTNPFYIVPDNRQVVRKVQYKSETGLSPITVISACQPFQLNFETHVDGNYYGTLSYAYYKVLNSLDAWSTTCYPAIVQQTSRLTRRQIPMVESTK